MDDLYEILKTASGILENCYVIFLAIKATFKRTQVTVLYNIFFLKKGSVIPFSWTSKNLFKCTISKQYNG